MDNGREQAMRGRYLAAVVLALALIATSFATAQDDMPRGRGRGAGAARGGKDKSFSGDRQVAQQGKLLSALLQNPELAEELGLTEDQLAEIKSVTGEHRRASMELRHEMEEAALVQVERLSADEIDEDAVMDAVEKTGEIRTEMAKLTMKQFLAFREILTPEQIEKAKDMRQRMREKRMQKGREGQGRGGRMQRDVSGRRGGMRPPFEQSGDDRPPPPPPEE